MKFIDAITISGTRKRSEDGALVVDARAARTGIQVYAGYEVGRPDLSAVRVFRSADEVFSRDSLASFAHRPVTNDHPNEAVTSANWKDVAVGQTADEVTATDIYVRVPLLISDQSAINDVESGKRELSAGYSCDLDWTPGLTSKGESFDAQQRNIRINHVAIVSHGRAGKECRIGDENVQPWGAMPVNDQKERVPMANKMMMVDGLPIEVTDQSEAMIVRLQKMISDGVTNVAKLVADHAAALADKDKTVGELTVKVKTLEDAAMTPEKLDKIVADRSALIETARKIVADVKVEGLSDADIRKAVVVAKHGEAIVKDASDAMIDGMFAVLTVAAKDGKPGATVDSFRQAVQTQPISDGANDHGQSKYDKRIADAWKNTDA